MKTLWICSITVISIFLHAPHFTEVCPAKSIERTKEVYTTNCMDCHNEDGSAAPGMYPLLAKSDYLKKALTK